jgi:hypothetical protein
MPMSAGLCHFGKDVHGICMTAGNNVYMTMFPGLSTFMGKHGSETTFLSLSTFRKPIGCLPFQKHGSETSASKYRHEK